jgi:sarcosine oxidase, subunit beta
MTKTPRYSAWNLFRKGLSRSPWPRVLDHHELEPSYEVVIVGGGVHGLATAYYLARNHGITDVAVIEKSYIGSGGSGRNTAIVRSNYLTPEGSRFYDRSVKLYEGLADDLNFNVMFEQRGHMTLAHSDSSLRTMRWRAEVNKLEGIDSSVISPEAVKELAPFLDVTDHPRYPIVGALWHPPGGIIRHDAVVWGYARAANARGAHIHQETEVTGIDVTDGRVTGVPDQPRSCRHGHCDQLHRRLGIPGGGHGRGDPAHNHPAPPGGGDRAGETVPPPGDRVGESSHLCQPNLPWGAGVRSQRRPFRQLLHPGVT